MSAVLGGFGRVLLFALGRHCIGFMSTVFGGFWAFWAVLCGFGRVLLFAFGRVLLPACLFALDGVFC